MEKVANVNNQPVVLQRQINNYAAALVFARTARAMNKGTNFEQSTKHAILKSMILNFGLSTADARRIYRAARKAD